ncbi:MAG: beta-galactosidase [candidate division Zixibacteria bacterium]|nr:beta-galactosidase [candidate division Zixibacteria bacterium]
MFEIINNKIDIGKETVYPFAAELHYFRLEKKYWSLCFERAKRAGIRLITTPVPWSLHQDKNRAFDFVGIEDSRKDLTVFLELARELGFKVILRPGPYIGDDWPNGGIPEFVTSDLRSLARDYEYKEIPLSGAPGIKGGYLASYMSPSYQNSVKHYFKTFVEITRNYIHPRGPVIMIELDSQPSFGKRLHPSAIDYNKDMLEREFPPFLMDRYGEIKDLNSCYKTKYEDFGQVEPPTEFDGADHKSLPRIFDWYRFREFLLQRYQESLLTLYEGYVVHPIYMRSLFFAPKNLTPFYDLNLPNGTFATPISAGSITYRDTYADVARQCRYLRGSTKFAWGASYPSGRAAEDPARSESSQPISDGERRFLLASALGSGLKGINLKMFADHEHWYGGALKQDGSVTEGYEFIRRIVESAERMNLSELVAPVSIVVVGNRRYQWFAQLSGQKEFKGISRLVNESLPNLCRDLSRLKLDFDICDSSEIGSLENYKLVIIPSGEFMAESEQQAIVDLYKSGVSVTLFGSMPKYDESMKACAVLSNFLKIRSAAVNSIRTIQLKTDSFSAYVYSNLKQADSRSKIIATADKNPVGLTSAKKNCAISFFGFDISSGFDHHKLLFLESFFKNAGITPIVYCSDPLVDAYVQSAAQKIMVFLIAPPTGELGDRVETSRREIFLKVNLRALGFKSPNIKINDLFADEETPPLKSTTAALAEGISLELNFPEGKALLIERR